LVRLRVYSEKTLTYENFSEQVVLEEFRLLLDQQAERVLERL
jgi:hypothetical protein